MFDPELIDLLITNVSGPCQEIERETGRVPTMAFIGDDVITELRNRGVVPQWRWCKQAGRPLLWWMNFQSVAVWSWEETT